MSIVSSVTLIRSNISHVSVLSIVNLKKSWSLLKEIINKKHERIAQTKFIINKVVTPDKKQISECFNKFYKNVGSNLAKNIPQNQTHPMSYMKNSNTKTIYLESVTENEVSAIVNALKISSGMTFPVK